MLQLLNLLFLSRHCLPKPFYPKAKRPSHKGKVAIPKAGKKTRIQWTGKLDEAKARITNLKNHINLPSQTVQALYTMALTWIEHHHIQLKSKNGALVTATTYLGKQKIMNVY
jgi:hypothetical protein